MFSILKKALKSQKADIKLLALSKEKKFKNKNNASFRLIDNVFWDAIKILFLPNSKNEELYLKYVKEELFSENNQKENIDNEIDNKNVENTDYIIKDEIDEELLETNISNESNLNSNGDLTFIPVEFEENLIINNIDEIKEKEDKIVNDKKEKEVNIVIEEKDSKSKESNSEIKLTTKTSEKEIPKVEVEEKSKKEIFFESIDQLLNELSIEEEKKQEEIEINIESKENTNKEKTKTKKEEFLDHIDDIISPKEEKIKIVVDSNKSNKTKNKNANKNNNNNNDNNKKDNNKDKKKNQKNTKSNNNKNNQKNNTNNNTNNTKKQNNQSNQNSKKNKTKKEKTNNKSNNKNNN